MSGFRQLGSVDAERRSLISAGHLQEDERRDVGAEGDLSLLVVSGEIRLKARGCLGNNAATTHD